MPLASASFLKLRSAAAFADKSRRTLCSTFFFEYPHPKVKHGGNDFVIIIETAEHESMLWQIDRLPRRCVLGDLTLAVVNLIAIRQMNDFLSKELLVL